MMYKLEALNNINFIKIRSPGHPNRKVLRRRNTGTAEVTFLATDSTLDHLRVVLNQITFHLDDR
jgi:hypothetical protein